MGKSVKQLQADEKRKVKKISNLEKELKKEKAALATIKRNIPAARAAEAKKKKAKKGKKR